MSTGGDPTAGLPDEGHLAVRRTAHASPEQVWDVLADGWLYATWVVGASRLRDVDATWPAPGSRLHHSVGIWPAVVNDHSEVLVAQPGRRLVLRARGWPVGEALVEIRLASRGPDRCEITMLEDASSGPTLALPRALRQPLFGVRNREALHRLALLAEGRSGGVTSEDTSG